MSNNNDEELDVHSFIQPKYKTKTVKITMSNETQQMAVDKAADDYFKLSHSRLKNEQQKEYERELFIAGANCMIRIINKTQTEMKNETKQTAVDKIVALLNKKGFAPVLTEEEIKFFKEMEKEQHKKTYNQSLMSNFQTFDDYYNETYGGNK